MKNLGRVGLGFSFLVGTAAAIAAGCTTSSTSDGTVVADPYYNAVSYDYYDPYWSSSFYYGGGWYYLDPTSNAALSACVPTKTVVATAMECDKSYDSNINLQWNCSNVGTEAAAIMGSAQVATLLTPDTCPATTITGSKDARSRDPGRPGAARSSPMVR